MRHIVWSVIALGVVSAGAFADGLVQPTYTREQAKRGEAIFKDNCAELCHGNGLDNGDAPPLKGEPFKTHWGAGALDAPFMLMLEKMPPTNPGGFPPQAYVDVLAFILSHNDVPPGDKELPPDIAQLATMQAPK